MPPENCAPMLARVPAPSSPSKVDSKTRRIRVANRRSAMSIRQGIQRRPPFVVWISWVICRLA